MHDKQSKNFTVNLAYFITRNYNCKLLSRILIWTNIVDFGVKYVFNSLMNESYQETYCFHTTFTTTTTTKVFFSDTPSQPLPPSSAKNNRSQKFPYAFHCDDGTLDLTNSS